MTYDMRKKLDPSGKSLGRTSPPSHMHRKELKTTLKQLMLPEVVIYAPARIWTLLLAFAVCPLLGQLVFS
jgi:hypothetical protein